MSYTGFNQLSTLDVTSTSTYKGGKTLGEIGVTRDGRVYQYASAGLVALAAGKITTAAAQVTGHFNIAVQTAMVVGDRVALVTTATTALTADQYADGYLSVVDVSGVGQSLLVTGNSAVSAAGGTATIYLQDGVLTAASTSAKASLVPSKFANSIISANSVSLVCNGAPNVAVAASSYYWSQVRGTAAVLSDGVVAKAAGGIISDAVNGAIETEVAATVTQRISYAPEATVDTKYYPQFLTLA